MKIVVVCITLRLAVRIRPPEPIKKALVRFFNWFPQVLTTHAITKGRGIFRLLITHSLPFLLLSLGRLPLEDSEHIRLARSKVVVGKINPHC